MPLLNNLRTLLHLLVRILIQEGQEMPPHQTFIVTRVLWTQSTYQGLGRQGTHYKKDSMTQVKLKSSCLFLLNGRNPFTFPHNILKE
jgi:hypothetical protein